MPLNDVIGFVFVDIKLAIFEPGIVPINAIRKVMPTSVPLNFKTSLRNVIDTVVNASAPMHYNVMHDTLYVINKGLQ